MSICTEEIHNLYASQAIRQDAHDLAKNSGGDNYGKQNK